MGVLLVMMMIELCDMWGRKRQWDQSWTRMGR